MNTQKNIYLHKKNQIAKIKKKKENFFHKEKKENFFNKEKKRIEKYNSARLGFS
jgi:hypothetical protein